MIRTHLLRLLLFPISLIFGLFISLRDGLYRNGLLRSVKFNIPVIGIGNLSLGGAGKTPHVEYLISILEPYLEIGILSRGYKRISKGFRLIGQGDTALTAGDEPLQYYIKYRTIKVAVSESRSIGIPMLLSAHPEIQVILLDDSYQHRSITPGLNILLTEYNLPYTRDFILPAGRLREWRSGADRADIVIVTKCPDNLDSSEKPVWEKELELLPHQSLFFSRYIYERPYHLFNGQRRDLHTFDNLLLLCAIANESYLVYFLNKNNLTVETMIYEDHHIFSAHEMSLLSQTFEHLAEGENAIITTEKDATRLYLHKDYLLQRHLPIYVLPAKVEILFGEGQAFDSLIKGFLFNFRA